MKKLANAIGLVGLLLLTVVATRGANAHGEDKPGPNGGAIRMPGAFHVEVQAMRPATLRIHLLDMEFKNPVTGKDSEVQAVISKAGKTTKLKCKAKDDAFDCVMPKGLGNRADELRVTAKRAGAQGNEVKYPLPLVVPEASNAPSKTEKPKSPHQGHGHH